MQTVNFHCPHCGNLMAVGTNLLGRNVRCPHCKQVVRAPAAAGEPPAVHVPAPQAPPLTPAPQFNVPKPTEHHESIFGERHDEDLFGSEPPRPVLPTVAATAPPPALQYTETQPYVPPAPPEYSLEPPPIEPDRDRPDHDGVAEPRYRRRPARTETPATPAFAWILLAYAAAATVIAVVFAYLYFTRETKPAHPFGAIPDFYGEYEKANRKQVSFKGFPDPKTAVPPELRVKLGEQLVVGDLQVRPLVVTKQVMKSAREDAVKERIESDASTGLALTLEVKNLSADTTFHPNDPAFNRAFDKEQPLPYTALQIDREFYYGPYVWPMPPDTKDNYLVGYQDPKESLGPGQEQITHVTVAPDGLHTAGERLIGSTLKNSAPNTPMLWRVQLRRGLVKVPLDDGKVVEVSATTVIGVEFTPADIRGWR